MRPWVFLSEWDIWGHLELTYKLRSLYWIWHFPGELITVVPKNKNHACVLLTWLYLFYEQDPLRNTSFLLCFLCKTWLTEMTPVNHRMCQTTLQKAVVSFINCPTFLARIRATRRDISDGHQFSPNAVIAEHSSLCMAQSAFYTQSHKYYNST